MNTILKQSLVQGLSNLICKKLQTLAMSIVLSRLVSDWSKLSPKRGRERHVNLLCVDIYEGLGGLKWDYLGVRAETLRIESLSGTRSYFAKDSISF